MRRELLRGIWEAGMVKFGEFTLTSGKKSPYYVDLRPLPSYVGLFDMAVEDLAARISSKEPKDSGISSVELAGIPLGAALAIRMSKPFVYVRKEAKAHGTEGLIEGNLRSSRRFLVVDDVLTTGGSILHAARALREKGSEVASAYVLLDRLQGGSTTLNREGVLVYSSIDILSAVEQLTDDGLMTRRQREEVVMYLRSEGASV